MPPKILCTFPGKHGDLLWALPSIRAIAETIDAPVDLVIGAGVASLVPLLRAQNYLDFVAAYPDWIVQDTAPASPRMPPTTQLGYASIIHLGYENWPTQPLPMETYQTLQAQWPSAYPSLVPLAIDRPWITPTFILHPDQHEDRSTALGWTDEHFELKAGLTHLVWRRRDVDAPGVVNLSNSPRWKTEYFGASMTFDWEAAAAWLRHVTVFLGDCSALHVLACAVGTPRVLIMEPNPHRHHPIFYPYGKEGPRVKLICGNDGLPTFDARHVWEAVEEALR